MDNLTKEQRHKNMSKIKNKDTNIEQLLRKELWSRHIRYRKNYLLLPGKPDIAITKYKIAIFCDSEFWHGKDWEVNKYKIKSHHEYWIPKIERNIERDKEVNDLLQEKGWIIIRFWGKEIQKKLPICIDKILATINIQKR